LGHGKICKLGKPSSDCIASKRSVFVSAIAYPPAIDRDYSNGVYDTLQALAFNVNLTKRKEVAMKVSQAFTKWMHYQEMSSGGKNDQE